MKFLFVTNIPPVLDVKKSNHFSSTFLDLIERKMQFAFHVFHMFVSVAYQDIIHIQRTLSACV